MTSKNVFIDELQETSGTSVNIHSYFPLNHLTDLDICGTGVCVGNCRFEH